MKGLKELHPEFASANVRDRSAYWVALLGVLGVGIWGWVFDAPLIEFIVREYLKGSDAQVNAARILLPLAILIVEMSIAEQRHLAGPELGGTYVAWTMLAGCMALTVPGMAAVAQLALETGNARDGVPGHASG